MSDPPKERQRLTNIPNISTKAFVEFERIRTEVLKKRFLQDFTESQTILMLCKYAESSMDNPVQTILPILEEVKKRQNWSNEQLSRKIVNFLDDWGDLDETVLKEANGNGSSN